MPRSWLVFVVATVAALGCKKPSEVSMSGDGAALPALSNTSDPSGKSSPSASPAVDACRDYRSISGRRTFGYSLPGDPAAHPGCMLDDGGALQCPEDFAGWTPKSRVTIPKNEAVALLDSAEAHAMGTGCEPCPHKPGNYRPGFDPSAYPAQVCKVSGSAPAIKRACLEVCAPEFKAKLPELRRRYANTRAASSQMVDRD